MTDESAPSPPEPAPDATPFQRWLDPARPNAKLWRTVVGLILVLLIWAGWTVLVLIAGLFAEIMSQRSNGNGLEIERLLRAIATGQTPADVAILLVSFWGLWIGVWVAVRSMHMRKLRTIFGFQQRIIWRDVGLGVAIVGVYIIANLTLSNMTGGTPYRSSVSLVDWLIFVVPITALIFLQSAGEELLFRGYLIQNFAARFRSPLIWGLIPAILFGLGHASSDPTLLMSVYHVVATIMFAFIATVVVWRTGGISVTMGMHVANNFAAFLVAGSNDSMNSTQLWLWNAQDMTGGAWFDLGSLGLLLLYVLSPFAPFPGKPLWGRRKETRAAP